MSELHNVFISWSGERSRVVAQKLREWLPRVVQAAKPWMSDADIAKGSRGLNELAKALYSMKVGVTCLSPDNLEAPWLLFEAGALSKAIDDTNRLCTYLLDGLKPEDVKAPLGMFQATKATKEDTRKLIQTINVSVSEQPLREEDLDEIFEAMWPTLEATIKSLALAQPTTTIKRNGEDMIAEILELVRAEANRTQPEIKRIEPKIATETRQVVTLIGITVEQYESIKNGVRQNQKFLAEILEQSTAWVLQGDELRIHFETKKRPFAELLQGRESLARVRATATEVIGIQVKVRAEAD